MLAHSRQQHLHGALNHRLLTLVPAVALPHPQDCSCPAHSSRPIIPQVVVCIGGIPGSRRGLKLVGERRGNRLQFRALVGTQGQGLSLWCPRGSQFLCPHWIPVLLVPCPSLGKEILLGGAWMEKDNRLFPLWPSAPRAGVLGRPWARL